MNNNQVNKRVYIVLAVAALLAVIVVLVAVKSCSPSQAGEKTADQAAGTETSQQSMMEKDKDGSANAQPGENTAGQNEDSKETGTAADNIQKDKGQDKDKDQDKDKNQDKDAGDGCLITINNDAAQANTSEAVNGLHVYDPDSEEKDDYFSGMTVPAGKKARIFAYNLATPVSLTVEHDHEIIAERTYSVMEAWNDDDLVEYIEVELKGDLVVTSKALPSDTKSGSTVKINNEALGSVQIGQRDVHDGDLFRNGTFDFTIKRAGYDVDVIVKIDDKETGRATLSSDKPETVMKEVTFNDSKISIEFKTKDEKIVTPEPPKKSSIHISGGNLAKVYRGSAQVNNNDAITNGTYDFRIVSEMRDIEVTLSVGANTIGTKTISAGNNDYTFAGVNVTADVSIIIKDVTKEDSRNSYTVTISNAVSGSDATLTIGYVDANENPVTIRSGGTYDKGTYIGARALNYNSGRKLRLTAVGSAGNVLDSVTIGTGTQSSPGANGFYLVLNDDIQYSLSYAESVKTPTPTPTPTKTPTPAPTKTPKPTGTVTPAPTGSVTPAPTGTVTPTPKPKPTRFKITVKNGAASANTKQAVNGLHVYDLDDPEKADIEGTVTKKKGTKIRIFAYPLASDIHLKVTHNGKVRFDKDIKKMQAWVDDDKIQIIDINLKGDLKVITYLPGEEPEEDPEETVTPTPKPSGSVTPVPENSDTPTPEPENSDTPTPAPENSNTPTPAPENSDTPTPEPENSNTPTPAPENSGTPTPEPENSNTPTPAPSKCKVKVSNGASSANTKQAVNGLHVYDLADSNKTDIYGTVEKESGTVIQIFAYPLASDIHLKITHNGNVICDKKIKKMQAWVDDDKVEKIDVPLEGDLEVVTYL